MPQRLRPEWLGLFRNAWSFQDELLVPDIGYIGASDASQKCDLTGLARPSDYTHSVSNSNGRAGLAGIAGASSASKGAFSSVYSFTPGTELTLLAWFTPLSFAQGLESAFIRKTDISTGQGAAIGYFASTKTFRPLLSTSGTTGWTVANDRTDSRLTAGVPWFVAMRYKDGQGIRVYSGPAGVGGDIITLLGSATLTSGSITNTSGPPYLGGMLGTASSVPLEAVLHFVGLSNSALSEEQIKAVGCAPDAIFEPRRIWVPVSAGAGSPSLTPSDTTHTHTADSVTLTTSSTLTIADAVHAHTADAVVLNTAAALAVQDSTHAHAADGLALTTASALAVQDATHAHLADAVTLSDSSSPQLAVADATHAHLAEAPSLSAQLLLAVADAVHAHSADSLFITASGAELVRPPSLLGVDTRARRQTLAVGQGRRRLGSLLVPR